MNHIYRLVFNRSLGVMQAVSEVARSRAGKSSSGAGSRSGVNLGCSVGSRALALGLGVGLILSSGAAVADNNGGTRAGTAGTGGTGSFYGGGGSGGAGGGYADPFYDAGKDGAGAVGVYGLGGNPGGAGGSVGVILTANGSTQGTSVTGGRGGDSTEYSAGGGGGGSAVYANIANGDFGVAQGITLTGGAGGNGADQGGGGGGGAGLAIGAGNIVTSAAEIVGGAGGNGGNNAGGGGGGAGIYLEGNYAEVLQRGVVTGGAGGLGSNGGGNGGAGAGVRGDGGNNYVVNYNTISGGLNSDGSRAHSIDFSGDGNYLILAGGSSLVGDAVATGSNNVLVLDGTGLSTNGFTGFNTINANQGTQWTLDGPLNRTAFTSIYAYDDATITLGSALTGAQDLQTYGAGKLVLAAGTASYTGSTYVYDGTLESSGDFSSTGALTIYDATIAMDGHALSTGSLSGYAANITNASSVTVNQSISDSYSGNLDTSGALTVNGTAPLYLMGNILTPLLDIGSGASVQIGDGGTTGYLSGNVTSAGSLSFNRADNIEFAGNIDGGDVAQVGSGILMLSGKNNLRFIDVDHGTLAANSENALRNGIVTLFDGTGFMFGNSYTYDNTFVLRGNTTFNVYTGLTGTLTGALPDANGTATLTKTGLGTLVLDGELMARGITTVQEGSLVVGSTAASTGKIDGDVSTQANTVVGGFGTIGGTVTVRDGTLSPGMSQVGTLTVGGLDVTNGHLAVDLGAPGTSDLINVTGDASFNGASVDVTDTGSMGAGVYRILNVGGTVQSSDIALGTTPANSRLALRYLSNENAFAVLDLGTTTLNFWNADRLASSTQSGGGSGIWSLTSPTFTDATGTVTDAMYPTPGFAVFGGTAGAVNIDNSQGTVTATGMQFTSNGYTMTGGALTLVGDNGAAPVIRVGDGTSQGATTTAHIYNVLAGTDGLRKTDAGTLELTADNTFSGGLQIDGGTVAVSRDSNLGDAGNSVTLDGGTLLATTGFDTARNMLIGAAGGTLDSDSLVFASGKITGTGALQKAGQGALILTGDNNYAGGTVIGEGVLAVGNGGTSGSITGNVTGNDTSANPSILAFYRSDDIDFAGNISGVEVAQIGTGTLTLSGSNAPTQVLAYAGTLRLGNASALGNSVVNMFGGSTFDFGSGNVSLANSFVLQNNSTFNVADGVTGTLTGALPFGGSLASVAKTGNGTLVIDGSASYSGPTTVEGGTLVVGSTPGNGAQLLGQVEVQNGTTLGGYGVALAQVSVDGGTLAPGMGQAGTFTVGSLVMQDGHVAVGLGAPGTGGRLDVMGNATFNDSTLDVTDLGNMGVGVYRVVNVDGTVLASDLTLGDTPAGSRMVLRYLDGHEFDVANLGNLTLNYWNGNGLASATHSGGGTGTWSNTSPNFTDASGTVTDAMYPQSGFAVFGGAAGIVTVDGSSGDVKAQGMQFMTDGYAVNGDAVQLVGTDGDAPVIRVGDGTAAGTAMTATIDNVLSGSDGLRKTDGGTLVLGGDNTWSGGLSVDGGTVAVSRDANLGDTSNDVTLDGGALRVTGAFETDRNVALGNNGGTLALDADFAVNGVVSGAGELHKSGTGTLSLYAANTYTAGTWLDAGRLQIGDDAALGTGTLHMAEGTTFGLLGESMHVANNIIATGDPTIDVADDDSATLSGVISDGAMAGDIVKTGSGTLRLTGENTYTGGTTVADGTLVIGDGGTHGSIMGNVVDDGTLAFDRSDDVSFGGVISGHGTVQKLGGNTLTLTADSSAFAGDTQIEGGTLSLANGAGLGGMLSLADGATLTGTGKLGTVSIASGSTLTPGGDNAVGTFAVAGNLNVAGGSTYVVNTTAAGTSDTITVAGTASVNGATVESLQGGGNYLPTSRYTILTANGGVSGTFGDVSSNLAFLTPTLAYDANHVYLDLARNDVRFAELAQTRNQLSTATAVESQGFGAPVYDALVGLSTTAVPPALDTLSGASLASARTALIDDARQVRETIQRHLLDTDTSGDAVNGVWTSVWGHWGDSNASGGVARLRSNGSGVLVGADRDLGGVSVGVLGGTGNLTARTGSDNLQSKSTVAGLYAGGAAGAWQWQAGATYAWDRIDSHRRIDVAGINGTASARYDANVGQAYIDGGYRFDLSHGSLTPFVNVARVQVVQDGLTERNSDAALKIRGDNDGVTVGTAGLRGAWSVGTAVSAHVTLGYQHAWGEVRPTDTQRFVSGGDSFTVAGVPVARNAGLVDTGMTFAIAKNTTVDASYHGLFGGNAKDQGARLGLTVKW